MTNWIETERTRMRPFEEADAEQAFAWFSDAEVMQFIPRGADATLEDTRHRIAWYREHQARFGFSKCIIIHRETGRAIGDSGLFHMPDGKRIELGYRLAKPYWGAGYGVEVGRAWLTWFDAHLAGQSLFADVHAENVRSQRVLSKLGFQPSHSENVLGLNMLIYRRPPLEPAAHQPRRQRVHLVPHDPQWAAEFDRESSLVTNAFGDLLVAIHHIGSTAIPGISAKPIIDMLAVVSEVALLDANESPIKALGYEVLGEFGITGRRYFRKDDHNGNRTHQIHAFQTGSPQIERHLAFRDFMRVHPDNANQYDALKRRLAEQSPADISRYTDGKDAFISEMDAKAASWLAAMKPS
jgi:GrpB-like predicted nucleotidyltransferase (UPF0157 family)/RimJ/RimL family protein N-acetyltransferase